MQEINYQNKANDTKLEPKITPSLTTYNLYQNSTPFSKKTFQESKKNYRSH